MSSYYVNGRSSLARLRARCRISDWKTVQIHPHSLCKSVNPLLQLSVRELKRETRAMLDIYTYTTQAGSHAIPKRKCRGVGEKNDRTSTLYAANYNTGIRGHVNVSLDTLLNVRSRSPFFFLSFLLLSRARTHIHTLDCKGFLLPPHIHACTLQLHVYETC